MKNWQFRICETISWADQKFAKLRPLWNTKTSIWNPLTNIHAYSTNFMSFLGNFRPIFLRLNGFRIFAKVMYPKYSKVLTNKHWPYLLAYTMDWDCTKMLNHGWNHGLFLSLFKFFGWKYILNWNKNSGLKCRLLYCLRF